MSLTRRQFLIGGLGAGAAGVAGVVLGRRPSTGTAPATDGAAAANLPPASATPSGKDGILVLLTLYGGNDGLNTVIPYQAGAYLGGRSELGYRPDEVIPLDGELGLHPNLTGFKTLWDKQQLAIVRGVGYPNPNRSHFRSMDIWQSAVPDDNVATGWVGRWLDGTGVDPMRTLSVGGTLPRVFGGEKAAGAALPVGTITLPGGAAVAKGFAAVNAPTPGVSPLAARISQVGRDLLTVEQTVATLLDAHPEEDPDAPVAAGLEGGGGNLEGQLTLVSRLIKAGSPTRVYGVSLGGFDTHANEKDVHARLMGEIDRAVTGFLADLGDSAERVVLVAYSEFGRRVAANGSGGTDHGTAAPVFVFGPRVKGGFHGDEPSLSSLDQGDLRFTTDFRSVYATLLEQVLGVESAMALGKRFTAVPFL